MSKESRKAGLNAKFKEILEYRILPEVEKPGHYIGGEPNQVVKDPSRVAADILLAFPDAYELGMSHNGTRVLYHIINGCEDLFAERCFAPRPDMAAALKKHKTLLYSLETYRPMKAFSAVGISLQTELNFTNVPYILELGGVTAFSEKRREEEPFVIGGGPCMANPEPVADFFDCFVIGDGEVLAPRVLRLIGEGRKQGLSRPEILKSLAEVEGVYVPQFLQTVINQYGEVVPAEDHATGAYGKSKGIRRVWVEELDPGSYPVNNPVPHAGLVHDRFAVEVMRGCTQGCRFCQAGYWYRPNRELNPKDVVEIAGKGLAATGESELGLLSLSTADYSRVEAVTDYMVSDPQFKNVSLSLPSLRANSFGQALASKVSAMGGGRSATFAPETGSERLRKMINKTISDKDMYEAAENVFASGFHNIKLYTMVGLPTENLEDMEAFSGLIEGLHQIARRHGKRNTIHASMGIFIPKPVTPMQWSPFMSREQCMDHIRYVRRRFRNVPGIRLTWADWDLSCVEAFYSRGDRRLGNLIYKAYQKGMIFESFSEHFSYKGWETLWGEENLDLSRVQDARNFDEVFPWDFMHAGVNKAYLKVEYKRMLDTRSGPIPDCKWGDCQKCGIPGNYKDTKLASGDLAEVSGEAAGTSQSQPALYRKPSRSGEAQPARNGRAQTQSSGSGPQYVLEFQKKDLARFISHQATLSHFEKAFKRLGWTFDYSQGFNARPIIKNAGALPLGLPSECELLVVGLARPLGDLEAARAQVSGLLPEGMSLERIAPWHSKKFPRVTGITYALEGVPSGEQLLKNFEAQSSWPAVTPRGKTVNLKQEVLELHAGEGSLRVRAHTNASGNSLNPFFLFAALLGKPEEEIRRLPLRKTKTFYTDPRSHSEN